MDNVKRKIEKIEYDKHILHLVMLIQENILNKGINVYNVSCIYEKKDSSEIVTNLFAQTFKKQIEADNYFRMLYTKYASKSESEVESDIESSLT